MPRHSRTKNARWLCLLGNELSLLLPCDANPSSPRRPQSRCDRSRVNVLKPTNEGFPSRRRVAVEALTGAHAESSYHSSARHPGRGQRRRRHRRPASAWRHAREQPFLPDRMIHARDEALPSNVGKAHLMLGLLPGTASRAEKRRSGATVTNVSPDSGQHAWCPSWPLLSYGCGGDDDRIPGAAPSEQSNHRLGEALGRKCPIQNISRAHLRIPLPSEQIHFVPQPQAAIRRSQCSSELLLCHALA